MRKTRLARICERCGASFEARLSTVRAGHGRFCSLHCARLKRPRGLSIQDAAAVAFWPRVQKTDSCWLWRNERGDGHRYGCLYLDGATIDAHRFSWQLHYGAIPAGLFVCHRCDNKRCVRPDHLYLGTSAQNTRDARDHGLLARGERQGSAKLTSGAVDAIRRMYYTDNVSQRYLAKQYGVHQTTIGRIVRDEYWTDNMKLVEGK